MFRDYYVKFLMEERFGEWRIENGGLLLNITYACKINFYVLASLFMFGLKAPLILQVDEKYVAWLNFE